jgi:micrococcal nuclease
MVAHQKKPHARAINAITPAILLAAFIALAAQGYYSPFPQHKQTVNINRVIDGDTFETSSGAKVRLAGIDAPEYPKGCLSLESRNRLEQFISGRSVTIDQIATDHFGRQVAYVYEGNLDINKAMISEGFAMVDTDTKENPKTVEIEQAEREAKTAKRGIWSDSCENIQKPGCVIKGNYRKDNNTYIYHLPNCYNYEKTSIDLHERDKWFCSEDEATKAGFVKSSDCPIK